MSDEVPTSPIMRGEESPESDIDVMIEVENYTPEVEALIDELVFEINLNHDCLISAVIFGSKELHEGPLRESLSRRDPVSYFITSVPLFSLLTMLTLSGFA